MKRGRGQNILWRLEVWAFDGFCAIMRALGLDRASTFGGWLLRQLGPLTKTHHVARLNMQMVWPDIDDQTLNTRLDAAWDNLGRTFAEFPLTDQLVPYVPDARVAVEGIEHLDAVRDSGRGAVFVSGHFANWEVMAAAIVKRGVKCQVTYRPTNNPYVDQRIVQSRQKYGIALFAPKGRDGAQDLMKALRTGECIAIMNDQKFNRGVPTQFFGHTVETAPGASRLALKFDVPIVPLSVRRTDGARFVVTVHPPLEIPRTGDRTHDIEASVQIITDFIAARIEDNPAQWFWVHKRWPNPVYKQDAS